MNKSKLFYTTLFTFAFLLFTFAFSFAQENNTVKTDTLKTANTNQPNSPQAEQGDVKITDGTNTLIRITDEGTFGAIEIKNGVPSSTTDKLYNDAGTLKFDGSSLGGGSGATEINDLTDAKYDTTSIFFGKNTGINDDELSDGVPNYNIGIGESALETNTTGTLNTAIGFEALGLINSAIQNIAIGHQSSKSSTDANYNTVIGVRANYYNVTGDKNTIVGLRAGMGSLGNSFSGAVYIGHEAGYNETGNNKLYIENSTSNTPLIWGDFANDSVRINGTFDVTNKTITPQLQVTTGATNGYVLTSDATGNATWQLLSSSVTEINELTDAKYDNSSLFIGEGAGLNDDSGASDGTKNKNTGVGKEALKNNIDGVHNTATGYQALYSNISGNHNTANGEGSLFSNTTGTFNTASGYNTLYSNTTGRSNTAIGYLALRDNSTGENNTAVGKTSLVSNTTGDRNIAVGKDALYDNTTGYGNVAIGFETLRTNITGDRNTAIGNSALRNNSTGKWNTAIGNGSLRFNTSGHENVANGYSSLYSNTSGSFNTVIGKTALYSNTTGNYNVGVGAFANEYNQEGSNNTIIGYKAGSGSIIHSKSGNIFLGYQAGYNETSDNKLYIENSNSSSPLIWGDFANDEVKINGDFEVTGSVALGSNTTANGANSVAIGSYASTNNLSGSMILADNSTTTVLNSSSVDRMTMRFDKGYRLYSDAAASVGVYMNAGGNSWLSISDSTKKENFQSVNGEELLNKISQFKLTTWNYKTQDPTKFRHYGPMAQDFYAAFGNDGIGVIGNDTTIASADFDGINFNAIHALEKRTKIQEASIKYQDKRIKTLEEENENLKKQFVKNVNLENKIELLEQTLNKLIKAQPQVKVSKK